MPRHSRACTRVAVGLAVWLVGAAATAATDPFAACWTQFADKPQEYDSAYCFYQTATQLRLWDDAARALDRLSSEHPENYWLPLAAGHLYRERDPDRCEALYRRAADGFRKQGNAGGEIIARANLRNFLFPKGRLQDASAEVDRLVALESTVDDPLLKAEIWASRAAHVEDTGGDLGLAYRLLKQTERAVFPNGGYRLKRTTLNALGLVAYRMGRLDEALAVFGELDRLTTMAGDTRQQAVARYNILNITSAKETLLQSAGARQRLLAVAERTLEAARTAQHALVTLKTHRIIAALLAHDATRRPEALDHVKECVSAAIAIRQPHDEAACSWLEASLLWPNAPRDAREAQLRALAATGRSNSLVTRVYSAGRHMQLAWDTQSRAGAIRESLAAIDAIETMRGLQEDPDSGAELFSLWTADYYWFSGRLLKDAQPGDLDLAFSVTERMRARSLLDRVGGARTRLDRQHPLLVQRRSLLEGIAAVQRRLMDPRIVNVERRSTLEELEHLEHRDQEIQRQIAVATSDGRPRPPAFSSLEAAQSALADDEALLSFQVAIWETYDGEFGGGSWLLAATRTSSAVYRLPDRPELSAIVPVFTGLVAQDEAVGRAAAVRLYNAILAEALKALPRSIKRLIIVPDGPLHRLPFDALRAAPDAGPLAARYELAIAPSATLWLHWRLNPPRPAARKTLALADPEFDAGNSGTAAQRNAVLQQGLRLGRLPHARRESRSLERYVRAVDALVGATASERALKELDLRAYNVLHFAAHAVADEAHPNRSAVLLSPGSDREDGLLQAREIESLDLDGSIVVLSACQTAAGPVQSGEGVLSLARAFFAAGAQSVIGTRWPIRDEDAAALFDTFYRVLGQGATVSEALTRAKLEAIDAGRSPAAWASLVVLGNGALRPFPGGIEPAPAVSPRVAFGAVLVLLVAAIPLYRVYRGAGGRRRASLPPEPF